jgi:hypothetical protein
LAPAGVAHGCTLSFRQMFIPETRADPEIRNATWTKSGLIHLWTGLLTFILVIKRPKTGIERRKRKVWRVAECLKKEEEREENEYGFVCSNVSK